MDGRSHVVHSGPGIDNILSMTVYGGTTQTYYYVKDHLGSVLAVTDSTGTNIVESYQYDAWGNVIGVKDGSGNSIGQSAIGNRYLWQGREYSWATRLYYFRARWYDPVTGRWLSNDPIGISGGLNQYVFCSDNPVNFRDPFGLDWSFSIIGGSLVIGVGGTIDVGITRNSNGELSLDFTYGYSTRGFFVSLNSPLKGLSRGIFDIITKFSHRNKKKCPDNYWDTEGKVGLGVVFDFEASNWDFNKDVEFTGIEIGAGWAQFKTHTYQFPFTRLFEGNNDIERAVRVSPPYWMPR